MSGQQMPARIWASQSWPAYFTSSSSRNGVHPTRTEFVRSDIAERMAEALERIDTAWTKDFPDGPEGSREFWGGIGQLSDWSVETWKAIRSALSAFRSATQDTEAR